jgi:hypothetical protein
VRWFRALQDAAFIGDLNMNYDAEAVELKAE